MYEIKEVLEINKEKLVEKIDETIEDLINDYVLNDETKYLTEDYDKNLVNEALSKMKKRELGYLLGQADSILMMIDTFNLTIDKNYYNFLRHVQDVYTRMIQERLS